MIHLLKRAHLGERPRALPSNQHHRHTAALSIRHSRDSVGNPRPGGDRGDPHLSGRPRPALSGMGRALLVPKVYNADIKVKTAVVDGLDVTSTQREEVTDSLVLERLCSNSTCVDVRH